MPAASDVKLGHYQILLADGRSRADLIARGALTGFAPLFQSVFGLACLKTLARSLSGFPRSEDRAEGDAIRRVGRKSQDRETSRAR